MMKVYVVVEHMPDGRGGADSSVRGVYTDYRWANARSYDIGDYEIEEFEVDENSFE